MSDDNTIRAVVSQAFREVFDPFANEVLQRLAHLETLAETETQRCPHREAIARASNNADRLRAVEGELEQRAKRAELDVVSRQFTEHVKGGEQEAKKAGASAGSQAAAIISGILTVIVTGLLLWAKLAGLL